MGCSWIEGKKCALLKAYFTSTCSWSEVYRLVLQRNSQKISCLVAFKSLLDKRLGNFPQEKGMDYITLRGGHCSHLLWINTSVAEIKIQPQRPFPSLFLMISFLGAEL